MTESRADPAGFAPEAAARESWRRSLSFTRGWLSRSGTRAKEGSTNGAGIGDGPPRPTRRSESNPISSHRPPSVALWSPKPSALAPLTAPIRDAPEKSRHKTSRNRRQSASLDSPRERQSRNAPALTCRCVWSPKPSALAELTAPIRDAPEGTGHKASRNQRRSAPRDSPRKRQS
jgi:hypothetical protein